MDDPARSAAGDPGRSPSSARAWQRPLLWVLLAVAVSGNAAASAFGLPLAVDTVLGGLSLFLVLLLVLSYRRARPRAR